LYSHEKVKNETASPSPSNFHFSFALAAISRLVGLARPKIQIFFSQQNFYLTICFEFRLCARD